MRRRLPLTWVPLLAALLAGPLARPLPQRWSAAGSGLRGIESSSDFDRALPAARVQPALHLRLPGERQPGQLWSLHPAPGHGVIPRARLRTPALERDLGPPADSARHFPLFPTGPPSHG